MTSHRIVSKEDWLAERKALLAAEKEHKRQADALAKQRRALPWVEVETAYTFKGPEGEVTLAELFGAKSQLIVQHFMFDPSWEAGCKSCSFMTDHVQNAVDHLAARDVAFVAISLAPLDKLHAFKKRMGWTHRWVSSEGTSFNGDFEVSFPKDNEAPVYNYGTIPFSGEAPGISVFVKDGDDIFHTYSTFARGLDLFIGTYNYLDLVPKGRDEADMPYTMGWVRLRDEYGSD